MTDKMSQPKKASKPKAPKRQNDKTAAALAAIGGKVADFSVPSVDKVRGMYDRPGKPYGENVAELTAKGYEFCRVRDDQVKAQVGKGWVVVPDNKVQMRGAENVGQVMIRDPKTAKAYHDRRAAKDAERRGDRRFSQSVAGGGQIQNVQRSLSTRSLI